MEEIIISEIPFKTLLSFFERHEKVIIRELGDTWHPAAGFVSEEHVGNLKTVEQILNIDYDFRGLIAFSGEVGAYTIVYDDPDFRIRATKKEIEMLKQKLRDAESSGFGRGS